MRPTASDILFRVTVIALLVITLNSSVLAQTGSTTSSLTGTVVDEQGAIIPGAAVAARNVQTNLMRETQAGEDGSFLLSQLQPGNYEIVAKADGFTTNVAKLDLVLGTTTLINIAMKIGETSDVIEVTASGTIDQGKTENSTNINQDRIDNLPINRRNFMEFSLTAARVTRDRAPAQGVVASTGLSFNGQPSRFNNITVDGLDNNETAAGSARATFSQEAVQEFQVVSDSFSSEFGRALGGIVNIVTKGGSNEFHGNLFFFNRNDSISARDVFAPVEPEYKQYQFGGVFGGPIKKDRAFFFTSFERTSIKQSNFVTISDQTVKSAQRLGFALSNGPIPFAFGTTSILARADLRLSPNDSLYVRYNFGGTYNGTFEPFGSLFGETAGGIQLLDENTITTSYTRISPGLNLINEARFLYNRRNQDVNALESGPRVQIVAPEGLVTFGRTIFLPQPRQEFSYQFIDNVTLQRGRHQIKFGGDLFHINLPDNGKSKVPIFAGGFTVFLPLDFGIFGGPALSGIQAFDPLLRTPEQRVFLSGLASQLPNIAPGFPKNIPLADLALPTIYAQGFGNPNIAISQTLFSLFFQDDIKLRPNLLLKLGARYDLNRTGFMPKNNGNFSPRIALAFRPDRLPKLNLRAAYGIFFGVPLFGNATLVELTTATNAIQLPVIPFPFSVLPFALPGRKFPEGEQLPPGVQVIPQLSTVFDYDPNLRGNYSQQATFSGEYRFGQNTQAAVVYTYVRGNKLLSVRNINPVVRPIAGDPLTSQLTGRVFPNRGQIFEFSSAYDSYYNALTLSFSQRAAGKINLLAHYTFSKTIDNFIDIGTDIQETVDPLNISNERGLSLQNVRSRLVFSGVFDLDYTKNPLLRGFKLSTILNLESGRPYNLLAGVDLNMSGDNPPGDRPQGLGRNVGITPGFANADLRLTRKFQINEQYTVEFTGEVFNFLNRVNISEVDRLFPPDAAGNFNLPKKDGGRFTAPKERFRNAFSPRQFQLGLKFSF